MIDSRFSPVFYGDISMVRPLDSAGDGGDQIDIKLSQTQL